MKILPTLEGGMRIDVEDAGDWQLLRAIPGDAIDCEKPLAERLAASITDEEVAADWREFVVPELEEGFQLSIAQVARSIEQAQEESGSSTGCLWITPDDGIIWFSVLNQARLNIEERHRFGPSERIQPAGLDPESRSAFLRSQFYCAIQSLLLDHVLR